MTTDVVSAAPAGIGNPPNMATGTFVSDGNATSLVLGFMPRHIRVVDETNNIEWEKMQGSTPADCYKTVAAGTRTIDTGSNILFPADVGLNEPGSSVLLSATVCGTAAKIVWVVYG